MKTAGFTSLILLLFVPLILGALFLFMTGGSSPVEQTTSSIKTFDKAKSILTDAQNKKSSGVSWQFDHQTGIWSALGTPPACPDPLIFPSPVDVNLASSILYPGQLRGGDYKPHGGFRFDTLSTNEVSVYAPMDGKLYQASRHWALGDVQYSLYFINDCGIQYKLDHLLELTSKFDEIVNEIPMGAQNDSRTTQIHPPVSVAKGEQVATKVGLKKTKNVFFDFGVYDLRAKNGVDYTGRDYFNIKEYGEHAICWLNNLEGSTRTVVLALPGADGQSGKQSDYCK